MDSTCDRTQTSDIDGPESARSATLYLYWVHPKRVHPPTLLGLNRVVVGRDEDCEVRLASAQVSRRHVEITRSGPLRIIADLGSKNGIHLNGCKVERAVLESGDVLRIGDVLAVAVSATASDELEPAWLEEAIFGGREHRLALAAVQKIAKSNLSVVIEGETGTGKECFAAALHRASERAGPFVGVNCAVYSKSFAAAELFGYRKGAFTGAEKSSRGHIRSAEGGTLLLDEVIELPEDVQSMLLRVIENRDVLPLGETRAEPIDVRFAAASQIPLARAVEQQRFRADLRARLESAVVVLPPLRNCREIVVDLFCESYARAAGGKHPDLESTFAERLCLHDWPLNIRELDSLARRLALAVDGRALKAADLAADMGRPKHRLGQTEVEEEGGSGAEPYSAAEREALLQALKRHDGNMTRAAAELGISRQKCYRLMESIRARR
jgi:DNA-binding NtrC family response regulator